MTTDARHKVLVVDDNRENRELARMSLEAEDCYDVILAENGVQGVELFALENPDCILLDVRMPDVDGIEVCSRIRALPGGADVPIIFITALRDLDTFDQALNAGANDFLHKPVRPTELLIRVQAALKLRRMSADLREQYELVRRQRDDLMRLQLQKERLSAFIVHDLKNPVAAMDLQAQVLLLDREASTRTKEAAKHIRTEARSLMRLILNLLDISKGEEGKLVARKSEVDLDALAKEALETVELKASMSEVALERALSTPKVRADPDLLRRVIENLLDNAIRHTQTGGRVVLGANADASETNIYVQDNGRGISSEMREKIFDPFVQVASGASASRSGRGLGLTFCRLAIEAQGGKIWVEDANPGARVCVSLPNQSAG
jgi:signal transduction histidine kinase